MSHEPTSRQRVGGDVYLTPPGAPGGPRVDVGFIVPDWKAATSKNLQQAAFPGTAVLLADRWHEIYRIAPLDGSPHRTAYHLRPWDDTQVIRTTFELTPEACEALTREHRERQRRHAQGATLRALPFLTGLLPAEDQKRLETEAAVPAVRATMISASILLTVSVTVVGLAFALGAGTDFGEYQDLIVRITAFSPLALYLILESMGRMQSVAGNEPMGSLPVCIPFYILRALRGMNVPQEQIDARRAANLPTNGMLAARDDVRPLDHPELDLEVISRLPKDHWTANITGIEYQGEAYILVERKIIQTDDGPRHHFLLQKPSHEVLFNSYVRYEPEEVRDIYRAQQRAKTATWVETFPFLWGLTSGPTQMRLARQYNYNPDKWIRWNIAGCAALGAVIVYNGAQMLTAPDAGVIEVLGVLFGVLLLWEQLVRWMKLRAGELPGSLLGGLVEPVAERCLRWE